MDTNEREQLFHQLVRVGRRVNELTGGGSDVADRVMDMILPFLDLLEKPTTTDQQIETELTGLRQLVNYLTQSNHPIQTSTAETIRKGVSALQQPA